MKLFISFILFMFAQVRSFDISLKTGESGSYSIVWHPYSGKALCYPTDEMMAQVARRKWYDFDYIPTWNFTVAMQKVGRVFCRQLNYSFMKSIQPIKMNLTVYNYLMWSASCLGYETRISHCINDVIEDEGYECPELVDLRCGECGSDKKIGENETVKITSPGYPSSYTDNTVCDWTFSSNASSTKFVISVLHLILPPKDKLGKCKNGFLEIRGNARGGNWMIYKTLCGFFKKQVFDFNDSSLSIRWYAGIFHRRPSNAGFELKIKLLDKETVEKGEMQNTSAEIGLDLTIVVALVIGVLGSLLLFICVIYWSWQQFRSVKRRRRRRNMANTLYEHRLNQTPFLRPDDMFRSALPEPPNFSGGDKSDEGKRRKSSLNSVLYEDIEFARRNVHGSYIFLDQVPPRCSWSPNDEKVGKSDLSSRTFVIPSVHVTSFCNDRQNPSGPSDMPSTVSLNSALDSVFDSDKSASIPRLKNIQHRKGTYVIKGKPSSTHSLGACSEIYDHRKEFSSTPFLSQRRASEPSIIKRRSPEFVRMESGSFIPSHVLSET